MRNLVKLRYKLGKLKKSHFAASKYGYFISYNRTIQEFLWLSNTIDNLNQ